MAAVAQAHPPPSELQPVPATRGRAASPHVAVLLQSPQPQARLHLAPAHRGVLREAWLLAVAHGAPWLRRLGRRLPSKALRRPVRRGDQRAAGRAEPPTGEPVSRLALARMAGVHGARGHTSPRGRVPGARRIYGVGPGALPSAECSDPPGDGVRPWPRAGPGAARRFVHGSSSGFAAMATFCNVPYVIT